jgi:hypothetical protein
VAPVHSEAEIETGITSLGREPGGGLVVLPDTFSQVHRAAIILLAVAAGPASIDAEEGDTKVIIRCANPGCAQQLRVDRRRRGMINCPKCGSKFQAQPAIS